MSRDQRSVKVFLRVHNSDERLAAIFFNELYGYTAFQLAKRFADMRTPGGDRHEPSWHWRFVRGEVMPVEKKQP